MNEELSTQLEENVENDCPSKRVLPPKITKKDFERNAATRRNKILYWTKTVLFLLLSSFLVSFTAYALIAPNEFTIGGISGIAILLNAATNGAVKQSVVLFVFNLPLVVLSFFFVKKKFAILTTANIALQTLWLLLLESVLSTFEIKFGTNGEKIFAAIAAGICIGLAIWLAFKIGGSTGGVDILAVMIQRKLRQALSLGCCLLSTVLSSARPCSFSKATPLPLPFCRL